MTDTAIVRRSGTAIWRQIEDSLAEEILAGQLAGRLPNETGLAERFGVNRHTVRQAVKALAERGLVEVLHGKGTFVREDLIDYQVGRRSRLAHSVAEQRRVGRSRILQSVDTVARAEVQTLLALPAGAAVLRIDSLDLVDADERVIGVCTQYFPLPRFAGLATAYAELGQTHLALARLGVARFERKLSRITARLPSRETAQLLRQPASQPVLYLETVYVDEAGLPIEYGISRFAGAAVQLVVEPEV